MNLEVDGCEKAFQPENCTHLSLSPSSRSPFLRDQSTLYGKNKLEFSISAMIIWHEARYERNHIDCTSTTVEKIYM